MIKHRFVIRAKGLMEKSQSHFMQMGKAIWYAMSLLVVLFMGCQEEDFYPKGFYGYQVERLLTGGDTAVWDIVNLSVDGTNRELMDCADSIQLHFLQTNDTLVVYEITRCVVPDTVYFGNMTASVSSNSESNQNLFTDSLLFENGAVDYLIVSEITSTSFHFIQRNSGEDWSYSFRKSGR